MVSHLGLRTRDGTMLLEHEILSHLDVNKCLNTTFEGFLPLYLMLEGVDSIHPISICEKNTKSIFLEIFVCVVKDRQTW